MENNIEFCYYMNQLRCQLSSGNQELVPKVAYYTIRNNFKIPTEDEADILIRTTNYIDSYKYLFPKL